MVKILAIVFGVALLIVVIVEALFIMTLRARAVDVISSSAPYEQDGGGKSVLILGDSTGYGTGASNPSYSVAGRLGAQIPTLSIVNKSSNGATLRDAHRVLGETAEEYDLILLQIGGNDILQFRNKRQIEEDARALLLKTKDRAEHVVLMTTGDVGAAPAFGPIARTLLHHRTKTAREVFMRVSEEMGIVYVDLFAEKEDDVFQKDPGRYHSKDGLHPSDDGYGVWFEKLFNALEESDASLIFQGNQ